MPIATVFVLLWFLVAFALSVTGWFERFNSATLFGIGAAASAGGFATLNWLSGRFRTFLRGRNLKRLTLGQVLRFYGVLALVKADQHVLPAIFAIPTGVMDVTVAITSLIVAARLVPPRRRPGLGFFAWHLCGVMTLLISATLAVLTSSSGFGIVGGGITSQPLTWFPMSLVPTFIGPLVLILHLIALEAARVARKSK